MCGCACHLSAALRLSDSRLWDGSGRQWRQQANKVTAHRRLLRWRCPKGQNTVQTAHRTSDNLRRLKHKREVWLTGDRHWVAYVRPVQRTGATWTWWGCLKPDLSASFCLALSLSHGPERRFTYPVWQSTPRPAKQIKQLPQARGALEHVLVPRGPTLSGNVLKIDWCSVTIWSHLNNIIKT